MDILLLIAYIISVLGCLFFIYSAIFIYKVVNPPWFILLLWSIICFIPIYNLFSVFVLIAVGLIEIDLIEIKWLKWFTTTVRKED